MARKKAKKKAATLRRKAKAPRVRAGTNAAAARGAKKAPARPAKKAAARSAKKATARPAKKAAARPTRLTRARHPMPGFVKKALTDRKLTAAYRERPAYQQNDYLGWIGDAQREQTQNKRLDQMLEELEEGRRYMNMRWREV